MDCAVCGAEVKKGQLEKIRGTYIKAGKKLLPVCPNCQKEGENAIKERLK